MITVTKPSFNPRFPTIKSKMAANRAVIQELHCADVVGMDMERVGLAGSPTKVKRTFTPERSKHGVKLEGMQAPDAARELVRLLGEKRLIS